MSIYKKLHNIQATIIGLAKDKSSNNYKYVTGAKVLDYIKPLMNNLGLILKQEILSIDNERQDYKIGVNTPNEKIKSEILTKVMMRFTWIDIETGEKDENLFGANGQNDWEKGLGSALTYGERYFLLKYFHIATDEDDIDNPERKQEELKLQKEEEERIKGLENDFRKCDSEKSLKEKYLELSEIDKKKFSKLVSELKETIKNKAPISQDKIKTVELMPSSDSKKWYKVTFLTGLNGVICSDVELQLVENQVLKFNIEKKNGKNGEWNLINLVK